MRNLHHLIILVHILLQLCLGIKWHFDSFAIFHAKAFESLLEAPNLVDVKKTLCILFHFHAKEEMQITNIFHFELSRKVFLHLQTLILIITHHTTMRSSTQMTMKKLTSPTCTTYMLKSTSLFINSMLFKKASSFWFQALGNYFNPCNDL